MDRSLSPTASLLDHNDGEPAKKRQKRKARPKVSCIPCQRRKTKCEETEGACAQCEKRNEGDKCTWDPPPLAGPVPNDVAEQFGTFKRQLARLEREVKQLQAEKGSTPSAPAPAPLPALPQLFDPTPKLETSPSLATTMALPSTGFPSFAPLPVVRKVEAETEDAAQALESLALPLESRLGKLKSHQVAVVVTPESDGAVESPPAAQPGAFTSILLGPSQQTSPKLLEHLPAREVIEILVEHFFDSDLSWIYVVIHRQTFRAECKQLIDLVRKKNSATHRIDPAFLAIFYMVMTWAATTIGPVEARKVSSAAELKAMRDPWLNSFETALQASQWAEKPQVRAAQAILLKVAYTRTPPHGIYLGLETPSFFIWLGSAVRISQLLGLHKLGSDPSIMPRDHGDPAWPAQPCSLKREIGKRIWWFCVSLDWLFCTRSGMGQIPLGSFDTEMPLNADDSDLGLHLIVKERPPEYLSDTAFCRMKCGIARHTVVQFTADPEGDIPYSLVLDIGAKMRAELALYERALADSCKRRRPYHRTLMLLVQQNRILRLHRPYFLRGWTEPEYLTSTEDALSSASAICSGLDELRVEDGNVEHVWFIFAYGLSAVFVLYLHVLREEARGGPTPSSEAKRQLLLSARSFYTRGGQGDASPTVRDISSQAVQVIDVLLAPRGANNAPPPHTQSTPSAVAAIFLRIASLVQPPTATRPSSPSAGAPTMMDPPAEAYALDGAISSLLSLAPYHYHDPSAPFTTINLSDLHHPTGAGGLVGIGGSGAAHHPHHHHSPFPSFNLSDPHQHQHDDANAMLGLGMMATLDGNVFNEENLAARAFLSSFSGEGGGLPLPGVGGSLLGGGGVGGGGQAGEWDLSEIVGAEWT